MIGSLRGTLLDRSPEGLQVEVSGIGYRVLVAPDTAKAVGGELGDEVFVWVHHHVREEAQTLYGFATREERGTFEALIGAHGVGPALALAILSIHGPGALVRILAEDDVAALCLVPGVGKKTAARLLIELKSRLDGLDIEVPPAAAGTDGATGLGAAAANRPGGTPGVAPDGGAGNARDDVRAALVELGYSSDEVRAALSRLPDDTGPSDSGDAGDLLRLALAALAQGVR